MSSVEGLDNTDEIPTAMLVKGKQLVRPCPVSTFGSSVSLRCDEGGERDMISALVRILERLSKLVNALGKHSFNL